MIGGLCAEGNDRMRPVRLSNDECQMFRCDPNSATLWPMVADFFGGPICALGPPRSAVGCCRVRQATHPDDRVILTARNAWRVASEEKRASVPKDGHC